MFVVCFLMMELQETDVINTPTEYEEKNYEELLGLGFE